VKVRSKVLFQKPSKRALLHDEGIQLERLEGIVESMRELLNLGNIDFEEQARDLNAIKEVLLEVFDKPLSQKMLNDDVAAAWAVGFAQANIINMMFLEEEMDEA
jgi:hypothetical protein